MRLAKHNWLKNYRLAALIAFLIFWGANQSNTQAQDNPKDITAIPLEQLNKVEVYRASKFSQKASEAPAAISIITATDIKHYGYRTFDEVLRSATGFYSFYDRNYAYIGARGFGLPADYNSRILILIDGHRLNDDVYGSTGVGTDFPVPIDLIDRIEIVRGPGSSLYGTNAVFAVINVVTKKGGIINGTYLSMKAGSLQTYEGTAAYGSKSDKGLEFMLSGSYMDSKGNRKLSFPEFNSPENNSGIVEDADTDRSGSIFANFAFGDFSIQALYGSRMKRIPTASFNTVFNDRQTRTKDTRSYVDFTYDREIRKGWKLSARTAIDLYDSDGYYSYNYSQTDAPDDVTNRDIASGRWWSGEIQLTRVLGRHHVTAGTEWRYGFRANQQNYDIPTYTSYLDSRQTTRENGAYVQGEFSLKKDVLLSAGVRFDNYSTFGSTANPRLGVVYSPWKWTTAKVLFGDAFRAPNLFELYYEDNFITKKNPNLKPEKIRTYELVLEQYVSPKIRLAGSLYDYRVDKQITQATDPSDGMLVFHNTGAIRARGVEFELEGKNLHGIDARFSCAFQKAEEGAEKLTLANSPNRVLQLNLFAPIFGTKGGAGVEMRSIGQRKTLASNNLGGFMITNVTGIYKGLGSRMDVSAGAYNLFNKRYADPTGSGFIQKSIIQDGRTFRIQLEFRLQNN